MGRIKRRSSPVCLFFWGLQSANFFWGATAIRRDQGATFRIDNNNILKLMGIKRPWMPSYTKKLFTESTWVQWRANVILWSSTLLRWYCLGYAINWCLPRLRFVKGRCFLFNYPRRNVEVTCNVITFQYDSTSAQGLPLCGGVACRVHLRSHTGIRNTEYRERCSWPLLSLVVKIWPIFVK